MKLKRKDFVSIYSGFAATKEVPEAARHIAKYPNSKFAIIKNFPLKDTASTFSIEAVSFSQWYIIEDVEVFCKPENVGYTLILQVPPRCKVFRLLIDNKPID